jgi:hypothetical protein
LAGGQQRFSDLAIETALTLRLVFRLPLRQTEGFVRSLLTVMRAGLDAPDHTTLSRRSQLLDVATHDVPATGPLHLIVDSTGLSVVGAGEWAAAKHGGRGTRGWKKLHLGVDRSGVMVAHALTESTVDDATVGIDLIGAAAGGIASRYGGRSLRLALHPQLAILLAQLGEFVALGRGQPRAAAGAVGTGALHPLPEGGLGEVEVAGDRAHALALVQDQADGLGFEVVIEAAPGAARRGLGGPYGPSYPPLRRCPRDRIKLTAPGANDCLQVRLRLTLARLSQPLTYSKALALPGPSARRGERTGADHRFEEGPDRVGDPLRPGGVGVNHVGLIEIEVAEHSGQQKGHER